VTFETERKTAGRRPLALVEINIDKCENVYGQAPCTAVLPGVGLQCYNTFQTCQDKPNYLKGFKSLRFCEDIAGLPVGFGAIPSIVKGGVTLDPTIIDPAKTLGIRAKTTITFKDHPYTDSTTDPYVFARSYDPLETGTFWGKFIARHPNYEGRELTVTIGYLDDDNNFLTQYTRVFIIDKIQGPDSNGQVKVIAKDILALAENTKTKLPRASNGKLAAGVNSSVTVLNLLPGQGSQYQTAGVVLIDRELCNYTRAGDVLTVTRGEYGSEAADHAADATVQESISYNNVNVIDIVRDLLLRIGTDPAYIPFTEWEQERDDWLTFNEYTRIISKPTGVNQLLNELCEQSLISIWWDERLQKINLKSMSPPLDISTVPALNDEANFIRDSLKLTRLTDERITQLWLYNELRDQTDDNKKQDSYQRVNVSIDADAENTDFFGDVRERIILGTWLTDVSNAVKIDIATKTLNKFKLSPVKVNFSCDAKDAELWTGSIIFVKTDQIQTPSGEPSTLILLITKAKESVTGTRIDYEASTAFDYAIKLGRWTEDNIPNYLQATEQQRLVNGFYADDNGNLPDGSPAYAYI